MQVLQKTLHDQLTAIIIRQGKVAAMRAYISQTGDRLDIARRVVDRIASDIRPGPSKLNRS